MDKFGTQQAVTRVGNFNSGMNESYSSSQQFHTQQQAPSGLEPYRPTSILQNNYNNHNGMSTQTAYNSYLGFKPLGVGMDTNEAELRLNNPLANLSDTGGNNE